MSFEVRDELRDMWRVLADVQRQLQYIPARPASVYPSSGLIEDTADELIAAGGTGLVGGVSVKNATGYPVWSGSQVWLDPDRQYIVGSNSANLVSAEWDGVGAKTEVESYDIASTAGNPNANRTYYEDTGVTNAAFAIEDPLGLLASVTSDEPGVIFATGFDGTKNLLVVISTEAGGTGGGGGTWTGWPGPDPTTGVAPGIVFLATVNEASHVISSDGTFDFDGTTAIFGTAPASGTCNNTFAKAFIDGETFLCFGDNAGVYDAVKLGVNIARCQTAELVDHTSGDAEFDADTFVSIAGAVPSGTATIANDFKSQFPDNYSPLFVVLQDNGKWRLLHDKTAALAKVTTGITARSGSGAPYTWGSGVMTILTKTAANTHSTTNGETGVTVYNSTLHTAAIDDVIQVKKIDGAWFWDVADCGAP